MADWKDTGALTTGSGGTGFTTHPGGSVLVGTGGVGPNGLSQLAPGSSGAVLLSDGSNPIWTTGFDTFTPTFTNLTLGNGTSNGKYKRVGPIAIVEAIIVFGTTTAITGALTLNNLPIANVAGSIQNHGQNVYFDSSIGFTYNGGNQPATTTSTIPLVPQAPAGGGSLFNVNVTATVPFTWAVSDQLYVFLIYPCA